VTVACVVVTRDRRDLLRECLNAVAAQTHEVAYLVVVDNAGSDGSDAMVAAEFPDVELLRLEENTGGAGGFHAGMKAAIAHGPDWVWLIDDDTIAHPDALERLLDATRLPLPEPWLLASRADWTNGEPHPMNRPILPTREPAMQAAAAEHGLLALRAATFVSLLVSARAIERYGLPDAAFFFQADDIDYTARILREHPGYYVPLSVVEHKTKAAHDATHDPFRFYHHFRNTIWMMRGDAWADGEKLALFWVLVETPVRFFKLNGVNRVTLGTIARGLRDGLRAR
jgi:GT2 family glycosyltransferase